MCSIEYKKGKFSAYEVQQVTDAVESLQAAKGYTEQQIADLAMPGRGKSSELLDVVESALTNRSRKSVMNYVRRRFNPLSALGAWSAEEDAKLMQAIVFVGRDWVKVEQRVGRSRADCRDRYRNHLECPDRNTGPWSPEEEAELTRIVLKVTKGKNMDSNELLGDTILWSQVSKLMEGKRNQQQCRIKWLDTLSRKHKMGGEDREWSSDDTITLLEKLTQKDVMHDTEIDWKTLPDTKWNLWSPHMIQRHWLYLKKRTPGHENMTYPGAF
ncbi:hypothetical protein FB45DRAFT_741504 [Roridomyces roridus]|uniref:MYB transcription factor n=1 Tax=Roridomyces roridus TaxID=1738132 RepID=A0AAD7C4L0_9AGAR|nr:hypothetical protein FB45DRAFT_741504 [Roridomyces roridus]